MAASSTIGLLGPVTVDGHHVPGVRARRLLTALALAEGRPVSASRLVEDVWGDAPPKSPQAALHTQVSRLRGLLGDADIVGGDGRYRLDGAGTDLDEVERLIAQGDPDGAHLLWRGEPGADLGPGDHLTEQVEATARRLFSRVADARAHAASARGDHSLAAELAQERIDADPLDESAHVLLMRALDAAGRTAEALATFARLRRVLAEQLGADPGAEATALHERLLAADIRPRSSRAAPRRLRSAPLIGRDDDLDALHRLLEAHRVVTVQGPGGVGKTSVVSALGDRLAAEGAPVFFVPLAAVRDGDDVIGAVAGALGVGESDVRNSSVPRMVGRDLAGLVGDALRAADAVLILDNCEQVIDACAELVEGLLGEAPCLRVLATSRSPLLVPAEQVYLLPVLNTVGRASAGVELFTARARSVRPDAVLDPAAVADLCARLDGLPLAIELAAARIRVMSVDEITAGLLERFALLRTADRTAPQRHRTLEAVIEWSWELLDDDARAALRRTCLFPGGFTVDAASAVTGASGAALADALTALVDQSLLHVDEHAGRTRYRMLEMVREFGERRAEAERDSTIAAMSAWARAFCLGIRSRYAVATDIELVAEVDVEVENLVWVLRQAIAGVGDAPIQTAMTVYPVLAAFWASRGLHREAGAWGARVIDALPGVPVDLDDVDRRSWAITLLAAAAHLMPVGDSRRVARAAVRLRRIHDPALVHADVIEFLSALMLARGRWSWYRIVLRGTASENPAEVRWAALCARFNVRENVGDLTGALRDSAEIAALPGRPDSFAAAMTDMTAGSLLGQQGQWSQALELYESVRDRMRAVGAADDADVVGGYAVAMLLSMGELDRARAALDDISGGWKPNDPTPRGNPETVAVMMLVTAEYGRLSGTMTGDDVVALFARAAALLSEDSGGTQDPGVLGAITATVAGTLRAGSVNRAESLNGAGSQNWVDDRLDALADAVTAMREAAGWVDVPHAAGVAFVTGAVHCLQSPGDEGGARLMAVALRLAPRHDYPAMHELIVDAKNLSGLGDDAWSALVERCARLSRRAALDEVFVRLAQRAARPAERAPHISR